MPMVSLAKQSFQIQTQVQSLCLFQYPHHRHSSKFRELKVHVINMYSVISPFLHPMSSISGPVFLLNAEAVAEEIGNMWRTIYKLTKTLIDVPAPRRLAENVKIKIDKFKKHIPILSISCNPGMKDRHWQQVPVTVHPSQPSPHLVLVALWKAGTITASSFSFLKGVSTWGRGDSNGIEKLL